jgi:hypothetical protein
MLSIGNVLKYRIHRMYLYVLNIDRQLNGQKSNDDLQNSTQKTKYILVEITQNSG